MAASREQDARDSGMTLVEVIVAIGLFAVMSTAVLGVLGSAIRVTKDDKSRLQAVNLASRELEIVRDTFTAVTRGPEWVTENQVTNPNPLPGGTAGEPLVVDGVPYTVLRTARWEPVGDTRVSPCDDGTPQELAYLHVEVQVTWPDLGDRPPVAMDTVMTPPKGTYSSLEGHIGLRVIDGSGHPVRGVHVTATKGASVERGDTGEDGCVLLAHVDSGDWTVTVNNSGYVNPKGDPTASTVAHVQQGQLWRGTIEYAEEATVSAVLAAPEGYALPTDAATLPLTLGNSGIQPIGARVVAASPPGTERTITHLWPYASGYGLWAGGCEDGDPALTGDYLPVATTPGITTPAVVHLGGLEVTTTPNTEVVATHAPDRLCTATTTLRLGTTDGDGVLRTSLPYGAWTVLGEDLLIGQGDPQVVP